MMSCFKFKADGLKRLILLQYLHYACLRLKSLFVRPLSDESLLLNALLCILRSKYP
jgi:hypothetical protein